MTLLKPYPSYKESDIEWIGKIPNTWTKTKVGNVFNITLGKMIQPQPKSNNDELVPYLKAMNIQDGYINTNHVDEMYASLEEQLNLSIKVGDVLVCEGGDVARSAVVYEEFEGVIFQNSLHRVRGNANGFNSYLHYLLNAVRNSGFIDILVNKATIAHFTKSKFSNLKICLPRIEEQHIIVKFLDSKILEIDNVIADKERLIELLEEKRQAIITEAVTKGLDSSVEMEDSGVDWVGKKPKHWSLFKIKHTSYVKGRIGWQGLRAEEFIDEGPYLVTGVHFKNGSIDWNACYHITEERYRQAPEIQLKENDLLITKDGTIGKVAYIDHLPDKASLNSHLLVIRPLRNDFENKYLYWYFKSSVFNHYVGLSQSGTTFFGISQKKVEEFSFVAPSIQEQKAIIEHLDNWNKLLDDTVRDVESQIQKLQNYRAALIYEAVTGKIDVRDYPLERKEEANVD